MSDGDFDGFVDEVARGVKEMAQKRPLEFAAVPLAKFVMVCVLFVVFPPIAAAFSIGGVAGVLWKLVIVNLVAQIILALSRM